MKKKKHPQHEDGEAEEEVNWNEYTGGIVTLPLQVPRTRKQILDEMVAKFKAQKVSDGYTGVREGCCSVM